MQINMRKVLAVLSVLAMLCTLLPLGVFTVSAATNLVVNGDFETGNKNGWSGSLSASADAAHSGSYGATASSTAAWGSLLKQTVSLEANSTYYLSFWFKSNADAATVGSFELKYKGNSGSETKIPLINTGSTSYTLKTTVTTWTQVLLCFATGDDNYGTTNLLFYRGSGSSGTAASISVDDVVLNKIDGNAANMLQNGGFEGTLDPWVQYTSSSQTMALNSDAHTGSNSVRVPWLHRNLSVSQTVEVEQNKDYLVTFYYKSLDSTADKDMLFGVYTLDAANNGSAAGDLAGAAAHLKPSNTDWTLCAYVFNSGSNTSVRAAFSANSSSSPSNGNRNFMLVDDVVFTELGADAGDEPSEPETPVKPDVPTDFGIVENGGFEDATGGWTIKYGSRTNADSYSGDYSLKSTGSVKYNMAAFTNFDCVPNSDYTVTFKLKLAGDATAGVTPQPRVYIRDTENNTSNWIQKNITDATTEWKSYTVTANSGSYSTCYINFAQGIDNGGSFYIDDIIVTGPVPEAGGDEPEVPETDNLIVNGDFETGSKDPWTSGSSSAAITVNSTNKHAGSYGAMIPARNRTFTAKQAVTVKANTNYTVTFWYKSTDATQAISLLFGVYAASATASNNEPLASQVALDNTKSDWTKVTYVFNSGSNTSVLVAFGSDNSNCLVKDYLYVDDIAMVEGGEIPSEPAGYVGSYPQTMTSGADIRFMTYNVLVGQDTNKGGYNWGQPITGRPEKACAMINYYKPDVIALEEFSGEWYEYFQANMTDYGFGIMQSKDSQNNGILYTCIAYNKNTIRLLDTDLFRNTVSRWGTQGMRYVNVAFCEVIATGEKFIAAATHPDAGNLVGTEDLNGDGVAGEGDGYWRPQQLEEAAAYVKGLSNEYKMPVVWGGDFNSGLEGTYDDSVSWYKVADAGFTDATNGRYIDHIFYNGMATHLYETTVNDAAVSGASDHKAVFADIQFLDEFATPIKDAKDYIKTQGRNTLKDGALWLDFSASGIEFSANCEGKVALNLNVKSIKNTDATYGGLYFTVIVDGVKVDRAQCRITSTGNVELVLAENLPAGNHTFEVYRQTEHRGAEVGIASIVMNGSFNAKPADNRLYIEFIGDSISTGYGALGVAGDDSADSPLWQDATVAYPYLTAKALGADFSDVCYSGLGCKYGYSGSLSMQTVYTAQRYQYDQHTQYNFNSRQPDVVVIALGTNDIANQTDAALRKVGYQEMLDLVRTKNPNSKIVWIYGMMKDDDNAMIASLIEENGGAAEGLYSCELTTNQNGAGWHPSAAGQQKFADELVAFLNSDVLVRYVGDELVDGTEADDLYSGVENGKTSRMEMTADKLGLAFKFQLNAGDIAVAEGTDNVADLTGATINVFGDGEYKLVKMGAIVTNDPSVGLAGMKLADVDGKRVLDINAKYLQDLDAGYATFAVRITNIPLANEDTIIYARAYYVFEYEGREVVVYDDLQQANYINKYESNDGVLEW